MKDGYSPPPGVGPHEGRELELMLAGRKRVALFAKHELPTEFNEYVSNGKFESHTRLIETWRGIEVEAVAICVSSSSADALSLLDLVESSTKRNGYDFGIERRIGFLLGYSEEEINSYIAHVSGCGVNAN